MSHRITPLSGRCRGAYRLFPLSLVACLGCGRAPVPVSSSSPPAQAENPHGGQAAAGQASDPHGGMALPQDARFAGVVRLKGKLAEKTAGYLFISVKPRGIAMPCYSRKYSLADEDLERTEDGERILKFELDQRNSLGGLVPGDLVLEAYYDPDGIVDTREPDIVRASVDTEANDVGIEVVLEPAS